MGIEKQIKQESFESQAEKAIINVAYTQSYITGQINKKFKPYKISMQQFNVLRILKGQHPDPVSVNDITDRMVDKMSNASRLVEKLRLKDLIERRVCKHDRRQVDIVLTEQGLQELATLNALIDEVIEDHTHISDNEYEALNETLDKMRKNE